MASPIQFNVGGRHFEVSRELIEQQPESMLGRMVSESWHPDPKEVIFIDRNGDIFAQVLEYLRYGNIVLPTNMPKEMFVRDLDYYGLEYDGDDVMAELREEIVKMKDFQGQEHRAVVGRYMHDQDFIDERMRAILVDWLCDVDRAKKGDPESIFLATQIIDRYLSENPNLAKAKLQLVGVSAFSIAWKCKKEFYPDNLSLLAYLTDHSCTEDEIVAMEGKILKALNYMVSTPTAYNFIVWYLDADHEDKQLVFLVTYIAEEAMLSYQLQVTYKPSLLAAAAILIGRHVVNRESKWTPTLLRYSGYREDEVIPVAKEMLAAKKAKPEGLKGGATKKY
ncbi:hypothetical protein ACHAWF_000721, partial [Thalassiosira exigua]